MGEAIPNKNLILNQFITEIEAFILEYRNFDLF